MYNAKTWGFRVLPSYYDAIRNLSDRERLRLYDAMFDYGFGNEVGELAPMQHTFFTLMQPSLEKSVLFFERQKANSKNAGRKPKTEVDLIQNESG